MRKSLFTVMVGFFLAVMFMMPGGSQANVSSSATALLNWSQATFTVSGPVGGAVPVLDWTAAGLYGLGADTRGSFSSVSTNYNGTVDPFAAVDAVDGAPWQKTFAAANPLTAPYSLAGSADTHSLMTPSDAAALAPDRIYASSNLLLNTPLLTDAVSAQAILSGQFAVSANATLSVTVPYLITLAMNGSPGSSYATAALVLSDFWGFDPKTGQSPVLFQDVQSLVLNGSQSGTLTLNYALTALDITGAPFIYDFEASATANSSTVPLPPALMLFGSGLIGLAAFRNRFINWRKFLSQK